MALPSGYTQLEYIESSGSQYIDTGLSLTANQISNLKFTLNAAFLDSTDAIMGEGNTFIGFYSSGSPFAAAAAGTVRYGSSKTFDTNWHAFVLDLTSQSAAIDDYKISITAGTTANRANFILFGWNYTSGPNLNKSRISYAKIEVSGSNLREFIPCKNASGTVGLWDNVNSKFYSNAGTGTFTAGPEVAIDPMAPYDGHNTNIGNVAREIEGGTVLIGGVLREVESGFALINGVSREIDIGGSLSIEIVTSTYNNGQTDWPTVTINGTTYYRYSPDTTIEVGSGTEISFYLNSSRMAGSSLYINGTKVASASYYGTQQTNYYYTVTKSISIEFDGGEMYLVEK